jgi:hypothetical protein
MLAAANPPDSSWKMIEQALGSATEEMCARPVANPQPEDREWHR